MVAQMIAVGEETGNLDTMLTKVADFYEDEVAAAVKALTSILEPIMIVLVGGIVGFIVVAMYMPMFKVYDAIQYADRARSPASSAAGRTHQPSQGDHMPYVTSSRCCGDDRRRRSRCALDRRTRRCGDGPMEQRPTAVRARSGRRAGRHRTGLHHGRRAHLRPDPPHRGLLRPRRRIDAAFSAAEGQALGHRSWLTTEFQNWPKRSSK